MSLELDDLIRCRVCGCTDDDACEGGCSWVEEDLCSSCVVTTETVGKTKIYTVPVAIDGQVLAFTLSRPQLLKIMKGGDRADGSVVCWVNFENRGMVKHD